MAKRLIDLQAHNGAGIPIRGPLPKMLGYCECGCGDAITTEFEYARREDKYFSSRSHFIAHITKFEDYEEVG